MYQGLVKGTAVLVRAHLVDASALACVGSNLDDINGVVVSLDLELRVLVCRVLPGLGQQAVVPVDVVGVKTELALLDVLLNGVANLILRKKGCRSACWKGGK